MVSPAGSESRRHFFMSIIEVARIAGVSTATVSRTINNHPWVSADAAKSVPQGDRADWLRSEQEGSSPEYPAAPQTSIGYGRIALLFPDPDAIAMKTVLSGRLSHGSMTFVQAGNEPHARQTR